MTIGEKWILLVEDNPNDEALTLRALKKGGILNPVVVARDGVEAIDILLKPDGNPTEARPGLPQVILLDLKLPKRDGIGVLKLLRADERTKLLPVVILTSSKEEKDIIAGLVNGANSYVCKPVDMEQFNLAVQQLGLYWLLLNERPSLK